jgi:hypothetical protein
MSLLSLFEFELLDVSTVKARTIHWLPFTNEMVMPESFRNGLSGLNDHNPIYNLYEVGGVVTGVIETRKRSSGFFNNNIPNDEILIQVGYYPISDIKLSIDNDNDSQDEKFFNQSGKVIDALSASKLVFSHTQDSAEGTKIRNARYDDLGDVLPLGQLVREGNDLYVVTQRSLDLLLTDEHEWVNVIYTLTKNRISRSENIVADSSVISYKIPDDNLVFRSQLYKDYLELSLSEGNQEEPYLPLTKALTFTNSLAGTSFDFTILADTRYREGSASITVVRHVLNGATFDLHKSKLIKVDYQDNTIIGYRLDSTGDGYVQTPIAYTNSLGQSRTIELLFLDTQDLNTAVSHFNTNYTPNSIIPFNDLTQVDDIFYAISVKNQNNFSIFIEEAPYDKDAFEIPVFEYMLQINDSYDIKGNVISSENIFSDFAQPFEGTPAIIYHYVFSSTRFTNENADFIMSQDLPTSITNRRASIIRTSGNQMDWTLFSTFVAPTPTPNTTPFNNVGIFAYNVVEDKFKFLFAINDYVPSGINNNSNIRVYINNWKI